MTSLGRWASLGHLTTSMAGSAVRQRVRGALRKGDGARARAAARVEQARHFADSLSQLKGVAMKVGQQAAVLAAQLDLPEDIQAALGKLHAEAEPVPWAAIEATLRAELEVPLREVFATIDHAPLGTASLAQAHAATLLDGTSVVVKVQHEGVRAAVKSDLMAVRAFLMGGVALGRDRREMDGIYDELRARLEEELDYLNEAVNLQHFHDAFGTDVRFRVPRHHPSLCTDRILTMDRIDGLPVNGFARTADPDARRRAGVNLAELFLEMAFRHRLLHADPHPGNYLFADDGTIGVIDFGCVKRFDPFWIGTYARLALASLDRDDDTVLQSVRDLGAWSGNDPAAGRAILRFCSAVLDPFRDDREHTVGGSDDDLLQRVRPAAEELWRYPEIRGPRDVVFLHRSLGGIYALARPLGVTAPWGQIMRPHLIHAIRVAEGSIR